MAALKPTYSKDEFARRGEALYERNVRPIVAVNDHGKFIAIDIESGAYEIDGDDFVATECLLAYHPQAQIWLMRVGERAAYGGMALLYGHSVSMHVVDGGNVFVEPLS
jgi:hypothetical protein